MSVVSKTRAPSRLPFVRGQSVILLSRCGEAPKPTVVRQVVNVKVMSGSIRYYSVEAVPGLLIPADSLAHEWEKR